MSYKEAFQGIKPIIEDYKAQGLIISLLVPNDQGWRFVQDFQAINSVVIPRYLIIPNLHMLTCSPTKSKIFTGMDLCGYIFFSIPVAFSWEEWQSTWTAVPQAYTECNFSQILKIVKFSAVSALLLYVDYLLLCSPCQTSS